MESSTAASSCASTSSPASTRQSRWFGCYHVLQTIWYIVVHFWRNDRSLVLKSVSPFLSLFAFVIFQSLPTPGIDFCIFLQFLPQISLCDITRIINAIDRRTFIVLSRLFTLIHVNIVLLVIFRLSF